MNSLEPLLQKPLGTVACVPKRKRLIPYGLNDLSCIMASVIIILLGERKVTYPHLRGDFMYEGDNPVKDGLFMIPGVHRPG